MEAAIFVRTLKNESPLGDIFKNPAKINNLCQKSYTYINQKQIGNKRRKLLQVLIQHANMISQNI